LIRLFRKPRRHGVLIAETPEYIFGDFRDTFVNQQRSLSVDGPDGKHGTAICRFVNDHICAAGTRDTGTCRDDATLAAKFEQNIT
jgi:hypothetical protein